MQKFRNIFVVVQYLKFIAFKEEMDNSLSTEQQTEQSFKLLKKKVFIDVFCSYNFQ